MGATVSVAVVSWNNRELLRRCLRSLAPEAERGRCEVWVVDNASTDGSARMVREEFAWVRLIASERNLGFGPAVNEVARRTEAPWIAPANADIELTSGALDSMLATAREGAAVVAPRLVGDGGRAQHSVHAFPSIQLALAVALGIYRVPEVGERLCIETYWDPDRPRWVDWAHGALLLIDREKFDRVGGFDPDQWMYAEDIDLQWRLAQLGRRTRYEPRARVRHVGAAATTRAFGADRTRRHLLATYAWQRRRVGSTTARVCALINTWGAGLRWLGLALASPLAPGRLREPRRRTGAYLRAHARALLAPARPAKGAAGADQPG
ncbi:MAG: glycosyltransferase family 2 protein [Solirubrobacterales bacterium]